LNTSFDYNGNKAFRILSIYERLNKGEFLVKVQLAKYYGVTLKTIQRDIEDLRAYFAETHFAENEVAIKYDKTRNGYYLVKFEREWLTNEEVMALCKILLESRAFCQEELNILINKLLIQSYSHSESRVEIYFQLQSLYLHVWAPLEKSFHFPGILSKSTWSNLLILY